MTIVSHGICLWWLAVLWTFSSVFPRPFDDWKNTLLYVGGGIIISIVSASERPLTPTLSSARGGLARGERGVLLLYFTICIASILLSPTAQYEGGLALARLLIWAGLAWLFAQLPIPVWRQIMQLTVASAAVIAAVTWGQTQGVRIWPYSGNFLAPIGYMTYYGDFMALTLPMAVYLWATSIGWRRWAHGIAVFFVFFGLWLSAARASLLGCGVAGVLVLVLMLRNRLIRPRYLWGAAATAVIVGLSFWGLQVPSARGLSAIGRLTDVLQFTKNIERASGGRWHTYVTSASITAQRPLTGWGLGSFRFVYPEFAHGGDDNRDLFVSSTHWYMHPHNEILHQAVELGPLGTTLFILGIGYLLYRGANGIRRSQDAGEQALLLMAMAGIVISFVSWQFSTNFLFPVSRLMTAFFVGMVLRFGGSAIPPLCKGRLGGVENSTSPIPSLQRRGIFRLAVLLSTLLLGAYQLSLYFVQKQQMARNPEDAHPYASWAVQLAPGAFDPLYVRAAAALQTQPPDQAAPAVEQLVRHYPYVPAALSMMGYVRARQGRIPEARDYLRHSIANDPHNTNSPSKQLLDQLTPPH